MLQPELRISRQEKEGDIEGKVKEDHIAQSEVPLIRVGRHFEKCHPTNKIFPRQNQEEQPKGGEGVSTGNSFADLTEECKNKDIQHNKEVSISIIKVSDKANNNESGAPIATQEVDQSYMSTKELITKTFTQKHSIIDYYSHNANNENIIDGMCNTENGITNH